MTRKPLYIINGQMETNLSLPNKEIFWQVESFFVQKNDVYF